MQTLSNEDINVVISPEVMSKIWPFLMSTSNRTVANYLGWAYINMALKPFEGEPIFQSLEKTIYQTSINVTGKINKVMFCNGQINQIVFRKGVESLYAQTYTSQRAKKQVEGFVKLLLDEMKDILLESDWMEDTTKLAALDKLKKMGSSVAYDKELIDSDGMQEYFDSFLGDVDSSSFILNQESTFINTIFLHFCCTPMTFFHTKFKSPKM